MAKHDHLNRPVMERIAEADQAVIDLHNERRNLEALHTLLTHNKHDLAPAKTTFAGDVVMVTVGVGKDHTMTLYAFPDDIEQLCKMLGKDPI